MEDLYAYIDRWNLGGVSVIQKRKNKMNKKELKEKNIRRIENKLKEEEKQYRMACDALKTAMESRDFEEWEEAYEQIPLLYQEIIELDDELESLFKVTYVKTDTN